MFGGQLENLSDVFHGIATEGIQLVPTPLFTGLSDSFSVGRYHSWVVSKESFPSCLEIIVENRDGLIMALRHRTYNIYGIQFHPESVLTPLGKDIVKKLVEYIKQNALLWKIRKKNMQTL